MQIFILLNLVTVVMGDCLIVGCLNADQPNLKLKSGQIAAGATLVTYFQASERCAKINGRLINLDTKDKVTNYKTCAVIVGNKNVWTGGRHGYLEHYQWYDGKAINETLFCPTSTPSQRKALVSIQPDISVIAGLFDCKDPCVLLSSIKSTLYAYACEYSDKRGIF